VRAMAGVGFPPTQPMIIVGSDGKPRCSWIDRPVPGLMEYHDVEWGTPSRDVRVVFEALSLAIFEGGLSWATAFRKRENLRQAFRGFDPAAVASIMEVDDLLADPGIIRNRLKVDSVIHNARCAVAGQSLVELAWAQEPARQQPLRRWSDAQLTSPESLALSSQLKAAGYRFVGPVVAHALLDSVGVINGHFAGCFRAADH
jgi:DNA-3-methyladenine glycosylase I